MENTPMKLDDLNVLVAERAELCKRLLVVDPPKVTDEELPDDPSNPGEKLTRHQAGIPVAPQLWICAGEKTGQYADKQILYLVSDDLTEKIRKMAVSEWVDRVVYIDGVLAGIRGVIR